MALMVRRKVTTAEITLPLKRDYLLPNLLLLPTGRPRVRYTDSLRRNDVTARCVPP